MQAARSALLPPGSSDCRRVGQGRRSGGDQFTVDSTIMMQREDLARPVRSPTVDLITAPVVYKEASDARYTLLR